MSEERIRLLIVDDQALVRTGFRLVLGAQDDMVVVGEASDGLEAVAFTASHRVDVVLMDIRMPRLDGVEAMRRVLDAQEYPPRVIVLTTFDRDEYVFAALRAGASGFLLKDAGPADLLSAIRVIHAGESVMAPSATRRLLGRFLPLLPEERAAEGRAGDGRAGDGRAGDGRAGDERAAGSAQLALLTEREREVLVAVGRGLNNREIAETLHLAEPTVKTHIGSILRKLDLRDRIQMVILAYESGLVTP